MHVRTPFALTLFAAAFVAACTTEAPDSPGALQGATSPASPGDSTSESGDSHGDEAEGGDFGTPSDDPNLGGEPDADPSSPTPAAMPKGNDCVVGGFYCGGDKVSGDPKTLYKCVGPGTPTVVQRCTDKCLINSGTDDACSVAPGARVASPVPGKSVTYAYGVKNSRYAAGYHTGEDYATPTGSNAVAVLGGTIRWSNDAGGAYGKWIGLDADNGRTYVYCHLSSRLVAAGTKVTAGQVLAKTGATGNVTGPHLHFEDHPKGPFVYAQVRKPTW